VIVVCYTLLAAAVGFLVARSGGGREVPVPLDRYASNRVLRIAFPADWHQRVAPALRLLDVTDDLALAPRDGAGMLVIGRSITSAPSLLPSSLLAGLARPPVLRGVRLGRYRLYRYLDLLPRGQDFPESIYALPTTAGTILGVCIVRRHARDLTGGCERVLGTIRLTSAAPLPLGLSATYARALDAVIGKLNAVRVSAGARLRSGPQSVEARAAQALAAAHLTAATAVAHLSAGQASTANLALAGGLRTTGSAYSALAAALRKRSSRAYQSAEALVGAAMQALRSAFAQLGRLGYRVS
jgi:hypothetical protein